MGIQKYGGCMKSTPCYVGVVKSMVGVSDFLTRRAGSGRRAALAKKKLAVGLEYILQHEVMLRQSDGGPITPYITTLTYPFSYRVNVIEILRLIAAGGRLDDDRCAAARDFLRSRRGANGYWRNHSDTIHRNAAWVRFDPARSPGLWISSEIAPLVN
ncbi:MAG: hypothetical protein RIF32_08880 [Leptospirales bacterium]